MEALGHAQINRPRSNVFVFVLLSALLLLLHTDPYLFNTFNPEKQRYVPALVNIETLLLMIAAVELYSAYFVVRLRSSCLCCRTHTQTPLKSPKIEQVSCFFKSNGMLPSTSSQKE